MLGSTRTLVLFHITYRTTSWLTHHRQRGEWHQTSYLDMVSLWLWKPISSIFAQHSFSFQGQNHIKDSTMCDSGAFQRAQEMSRIHVHHWLSLGSSCQANARTWEVGFANAMWDVAAAQMSQNTHDWHFLTWSLCLLLCHSFCQTCWFL